MPFYPAPMTLTNLFQYISFIAPVLVIFFITLLSIMQNNFEKGLIFNMGIVLLSGAVISIKYIIGNPQSPLASPFCNVMPSPFSIIAGCTVYDIPSMSTALLSFSSTYLIYPMLINNQQNYALLLCLLAITGVNAVVEWHQKCSNIWGVLLGILLGISWGILYYFLLSLSKKSNLVYFSDTISNNVQCSKPSKQNFKCEFYKDGQPYGNRG